MDDFQKGSGRDPQTSPSRTRCVACFSMSVPVEHDAYDQSRGFALPTRLRRQYLASDPNNCQWQVSEPIVLASGLTICQGSGCGTRPEISMSPHGAPTQASEPHSGVVLPLNVGLPNHVRIKDAGSFGQFQHGSCGVWVGSHRPTSVDSR